MNKTTALGGAVVVLAGACGALVYDRFQLMEKLSARPAQSVPVLADQGAVPASVQSIQAVQEVSPQLANAAPQVPSPEAAAVSLPAPKTPAYAGLDTSELSPASIARQRESLDQLPSWLVIPESKKDELAVLSLAAISPPPIPRGNLTPETYAAARLDAREERNRQVSMRIEQLLGSEGNALWKEYQDTSMSRMRLSALNDQLGSDSLQEHTLRAAAKAMADADRVVQAEFESKYGKGGMSKLSQDGMGADVLIAQARRSADAMREAARPHLSPRQFETMEEMHKREQAMQEAMMKGLKPLIDAEAKAKAGAKANPR